MAKIVGNTTATPYPRLEKISELIDDSNIDHPIKYASQAASAQVADGDSSGNNIIKTYAKKTEVPKSIIAMSDDTSAVDPINYARHAEQDCNGNVIHTTYITKEEMNVINKTIEDLEARIAGLEAQVSS